MMSVRSPQCSMPSSSPFLKEESASCMRIRDMTGKRFASRSASGVTLQESHGRSADAGVLRRIDAGSWKRRTPGSTDSESSWSDMRNYLKATRRSSISLLRSSVGGRWQLFTDKSLIAFIVSGFALLLMEGLKTRKLSRALEEEKDRSKPQLNVSSGFSVMTAPAGRK